jgi:hypothetical protein
VGAAEFASCRQGCMNSNVFFHKLTFLHSGQREEKSSFAKKKIFFYASESCVKNTRVKKLICLKKIDFGLKKSNKGKKKLINIKKVLYIK